MRKMKATAMLFCLLLMAGCGNRTNQSESSLPQSSQVQENQGESIMESNSYQQITPEEAKTIMDEQTGYTLLDVRTQSEFDEGHIEGAILIPDTEIASRAETELTDKGATILVYCRSGRRSKLAAQALADLGYTNVHEFGGIISKPSGGLKVEHADIGALH